MTNLVLGGTISIENKFIDELERYRYPWYETRTIINKVTQAFRGRDGRLGLKVTYL